MEEEKKVVKNKTSKGSIITIILLILLIIGMCLYIAYDKGVIFQSFAEVEEKDTKKETTEENSANVVLGFDSDKCINSSDFNYQPVVTENGLQISINEDKRSVTMSANWERYDYLDTMSGDTVEYTINNFSNEISEVFFGIIGQDIVGAQIFYLMADGSVEYTPIEKCRTNNSFESYGKLDGVEDIITLKNVSMYSKNDSTGGGMTTIAQKSDGTFYDLRELIN